MDENLSLHNHIKSLLQKCRTEDDTVAMLDPLGLDQFFQHTFPKANLRRDTELLRAGVEVAVKRLPPTNIMRNRTVALSLTRDLGFLAASLTKAGLSIGPLEPILIELATITSEVPRDSFASYTSRNPSGKRRRTFTGLSEEEEFITALTTASNSVPACASALLDAIPLSIRSQAFVEVLQQACDSYNNMVASNLAVRRKVSPDVFSNIMKPFYPIMTVMGKTYYAPSGAFMPSIIVDLLLITEDRYIRFDDQQWYKTVYVKNNQPYLASAYQKIVEMILKNRVSLLKGKIEEVLRYEVGTDSIKGLLQLREMVGALLKFRKPHKKLAEANMRLRSDNTTKRGSGGYELEEVERLVRITESVFQGINIIVNSKADMTSNVMKGSL